MIISMNNTSNFNAYTSTQPASTQTSTGNDLQGFLALGSFGVILGIAIFIIWIWSMISMISLNARFKDFYVVYMSKEREKLNTVDEEPDLHKELIIEPPTETGANQQKEKWLSKKPSGTSMIVLALLIIILIAVIVFFRA